MKEIFIIGGSGLVGIHVVKEFLTSGDSVTTLTRGGRSVLGEKVIKGDRFNKKLLEQIFSKNTFDLVVDMIPFTTSEASVLSQVIKDKNIPLIACSSADVYKAEGVLWGTEEFSEYQECPLHEFSTLRKNLSINGEKYNKTGVEDIYLREVNDVTIFRLPAIYGYPDISRFQKYLDDMIAGKDKIMIPKEKIDWRFCRALNKNCAFGIFLGRNLQGKNIYNISEEKNYTEKEWIEKIRDIFGWKGEVIGGKNDEGLDFKQNWFLDTSKIRKELGFYEKYDPDEGLYDAMLKYIHTKKDISYTKNY